MRMIKILSLLIVSLGMTNCRTSSESVSGTETIATGLDNKSSLYARLYELSADGESVFQYMCGEWVWGPEEVQQCYKKRSKLKRSSQNYSKIFAQIKSQLNVQLSKHQTELNALEADWRIITGKQAKPSHLNKDQWEDIKNDRIARKDSVKFELDVARKKDNAMKTALSSAAVKSRFEEQLKASMYPAVDYKNYKGSDAKERAVYYLAINLPEAFIQVKKAEDNKPAPVPPQEDDLDELDTSGGQ